MPEADISPFGGGAAVWFGYTNERDPGLFLQAFDDTLERVGAPVRVRPGGTNEVDEIEISWRVGALGGGHAAVVVAGPGIDADGLGIEARIYDASGAPVSGTFPVNTHEAANQLEADIAAGGGESWAAVWTSGEQDGSGPGIFGQRFDVYGNRLGGEFQISSDAEAGQNFPHADMDSAGNFVVTWKSNLEAADETGGIFLRAYRSDGEPFGPQIQVSDSQIIDGYSRNEVALSDAGIAVVTWSRFDNVSTVDDIVARRVALPCFADSTTLCLRGGRFLVRAFWETPAVGEGSGRAIPLTGDTGGFWFFAEDNFELLVKVFDGCGLNGNYWLYAAGLTDVEVDLVVTDTWTGMVEVFTNALGTSYAPVQEVAKFPTCGAPEPAGARATTPSAEALVGRPEPEIADPPSASNPSSSSAAAACSGNETTLCLRSGRFAVRVAWVDHQGTQGVGHPIPLGDESGIFWFFGEENLEVAVKVLDGCGLNERYWVYLAGLTDVEVELVVTDTVGGAEKIFRNPRGVPFAPQLDSSAFASCP